MDFLTIEFRNSQSAEDLSVKDKATVTLKGASLPGLGSADPASANDYFDNSCVICDGKAMAVVRKLEDHVKIKKWEAARDEYRKDHAE